VSDNVKILIWYFFIFVFIFSKINLSVMRRVSCEILLTYSVFMFALQSRQLADELKKIPAIAFV